MLADYLGTEIRKAIEKVVLSRKVDMPTALFVLTDGEVRFNAALVLAIPVF